MSRLSEVFWESVENLIEKRAHLLTGPIRTNYVREHDRRYADAVNYKCAAMEHCLGFIDGTVLEIELPGDRAVENAAYNGHKIRHSLTFETVTLPDELIIHARGPLEGRRNEWELYVISGIDQLLEDMLLMDEMKYFIHGDSGYNESAYLDTPFTGTHLTQVKAAENTSMETVRGMVDWMFKEVRIYWSTVESKRKMRFGEAPVGLLYIRAMLITTIFVIVSTHTL